MLKADKTYVKALLVKAEALYNTCNFEHALVLFHRGQVCEQMHRSVSLNSPYDANTFGQALAPDVEAFRLGIQKCRKTIKTTVSKDFEFHFEGVQVQLTNHKTLTSSMHTC